MTTFNVEFNKKDLTIERGIPIYKIEDKKQVLKDLIKIFNDASIIFFGIHSSQIQENVILKASQKIIQELNQVSIQEVLHSFERIEIKRQVTLTLEDIIQPVRKYIFAKNFIDAETSKILKEKKQEEEEVQQIAKFSTESAQIYNESILTGKWKGTIFHALTVTKNHNLKNILQKEVCFEFWEQAKIEAEEIKKHLKKEDKNEIQMFLESYGRTPERIFAEKIVIECIKQKIEL